MIAAALPSTIDGQYFHGLMTTLRGIQFAALVTGDAEWNEMPERMRRENAERSVWPDGHYAFLIANAAHVERSFEVSCDQPLRGTLELFTYDPAVVRPDPDGRLPAADGTLALDGGWSDRIPARGVRLYRTA